MPESGGRHVAGARADRPARPVVLAAHGTSDPAGRRTLEAVRDGVSDRLGAPVGLGFVDLASPGLAHVLAAHPSALVVPMFVTAGYHVEVDVPREARRAGALVSEHLGAGAALAPALLARAQEARPDPDAIAVLAAGSSSVSAREEVVTLGATLAQLCGVTVSVGFLSGPGPSAHTALVAAGRGDRPVAVPALLAPGHFSRAAAQLSGTRGIPLGAVLGAHPAVLDVVVARLGARPAAMPVLPRGGIRYAG